MANDEALDRLCINTIRTLSIDAIESAASGHPGAPMGLAPVGYTLFSRFLKHNPVNPEWPGRDRFVLSAGHASMLLYSLLHLTGYDVPLAELKRFRQLGSMTPGHPEYRCAPGVEVTSGPLGQGVSNAVGMALARKIVGARFNRPGCNLTDYHIYVICSDGDLMEGVSSESCSLAGHLGLGRLICLYDDNSITIEGSTGLSFTEDVAGRFRAYGWDVSRVEDANDVEAVAGAIESARFRESRPVLIMVSSRIACGSPNLEGCEQAHGAPLGTEEARSTKRNLGWPAEEEFLVPTQVKEHMGRAVERGRGQEEEWVEMFSSYEKDYPELAAEWRRVMEPRLPGGWRENLPSFSPGDKVATRAASGAVLEALAPSMWELIGGSADLGPSNKTIIKEYPSISRDDFSSRNIHFGVREHGMAAILNGMALHGGLIPYGGTFLVFSDYMRPAVRLAAMMDIKVIYIFTHDSLGVGEDGPTHQPIEQMAALRAIPNLMVIRPADAPETVEAWAVALERRGPTALVLSRQGLPVLRRDEGLSPSSNLNMGAYVLADAGGVADVDLLASGSEVELALRAREALAGENISARVLGFPSWELFEEQGAAYKEEILPTGGPPRLSIEAGSTQGWRRYVGDRGETLGIDRFGVSAPGDKALAHAGFTVENVVRIVKEMLSTDC